MSKKLNGQFLYLQCHKSKVRKFRILLLIEITVICQKLCKIQFKNVYCGVSNFIDFYVLTFKLEGTLVQVNDIQKGSLADNR